MLRAIVVAALAASLGACSLLLDFSDKAIPKDASFDAPDAPVTADECAYDEPNETAATAALVTRADMGPAAICMTSGTEDHDFYKFSVPMLTTSVAVSITFVNAVGDLDLRLYDSTGTVIAQSRGFGDGEMITCPGASPPCSMLAAGEYEFEVFPAVAGAVNNYTFSLSLTP